MYPISQVFDLYLPVRIASTAGESFTSAVGNDAGTGLTAVASKLNFNAIRLTRGAAEIRASSTREPMRSH